MITSTERISGVTELSTISTSNLQGSIFTISTSGNLIWFKAVKSAGLALHFLNPHTVYDDGFLYITFKTHLSIGSGGSDNGMIMKVDIYNGILDYSVNILGFSNPKSIVIGP